MTNEKKDNELIGRLGATVNRLNNRLTDLLEDNQRLKQQYKTLQEENKETFRISSELLQEKDKQLEKLQYDLNLEKQKLKENQSLKQQNKTLQEKNQEALRINSELKEKLVEGDEQLEKLQQHVLNLERQKNEIHQLEKISQNLEKTLEILELDDINEDDIKILKEKNMILIDDNYQFGIPSKQENTREPVKEELAPPSYKTSNKSFGKGTEKTGLSKPRLLHEPFNESLVEDTEETRLHNDVKVVVGLDFGVTYSGFAYCHTSDSKNIYTNEQWPGKVCQLKTNTVLQYDYEYNNVILWGYPALFNREKRINRNGRKIVELFKLYLSNLSANLMPELPVSYKKAITDYLREFGKLIKETIAACWSEIDFFENILLVLPVPAEYSDKAKAIMRECVFDAGLLREKYSTKLQFTTEPEAAAIYCMEDELKGPVGTTFMIVDCGGDTVDLTTRKLVGEKQLGEVTVRIGDFCGSIFIDKEFADFLCGKLGTHAIDLLVENNYDQFQYMVQDFCQRVKIPFTGDDTEFFYELDVEENAPALLQYVSNETRGIMEENDWLIEIKYNDVRKMFDPIVDRIISMIHTQLSNNLETCSAMFLVGGFSESKYLQKRIKQEFQYRMKTISVPNQPMAAIVRGAVIYGLSIGPNLNDLNKLNNLVQCVISTRVLKYTYGILISVDWKESDPLNRKKSDGKVDCFYRIAVRGTEVKTDQEVSLEHISSPTPIKRVFNIYYTDRYEVKYCDEPGVELLGKLTIDLPACHCMSFGLKFGQIEITAIARNKNNGQTLEITLGH